MLKRGISLLIAGIFIACYSCNKERKISCYEISRSLIGQDEYSNIVRSIADTISNWSKNRLTLAEALWRYDYKIDSVLCINNSKNKLVGSILISCNAKSSTSDALYY